MLVNNKTKIGEVFFAGCRAVEIVELEFKDTPRVRCERGRWKGGKHTICKVRFSDGRMKYVNASKLTKTYTGKSWYKSRAKQDLQRLENLINQNKTKNFE